MARIPGPLAERFVQFGHRSVIMQFSKWYRNFSIAVLKPIAIRLYAYCGTSTTSDLM